jgi:hypothetical protein
VHRFYKIYVRRNDGNGISALEPSQYQARFVQRVVRDIFDGLSDVEPEENTDGDVGDEEQDPKLSMASTVRAGAGADSGSGGSVHSNGTSPSKISGGSGSENSSGSNSGGGGNNSGMNKNRRPNEQQFMTLADIEPSNML